MTDPASGCRESGLDLRVRAALASMLLLFTCLVTQTSVAASPAARQTGAASPGALLPGTQQAAPQATSQASATLTPAAYRAELDRLLEAIDRIEASPTEIPRVIESIPESWRLEAGRDRFTVATSWLQRDLESIRRAPSSQSLARIRGRLQRLRDELAAYEEPPRDLADERARLDAVLARPEFAGVHGQTWFDRLRQRALSFLVDLLDRVIGSSNIPTVGRVVVWVLVGLAALVVVVFIYRTLRTGARVAAVRPGEAAVSAKDWTVWLAEARAAAATAAWRDAVRLAYWAGISFLESRRLWPPDRARTPREYLKLLPQTHETRPTLASLTTTFERVWYAKREADAETFATAVAALEELGCRSS